MDSAPARPPLASTEPQLPPPASNTAAGTKRPAPSLLPAFEPLSSSPALPRPLKRQNIGNNAAHLKYPTPVPTSSTGILSSSPLRVRPSLTRSVSERMPLSAVPSVELSENGEVLIMGRSSNSSHFQLSANRLVSRVHVKARYMPATNPLEPNKIEIICNGWNGLKLHCQGRTWELFKGDSFTSETEGTEVMVDVQDARVMIQWPRRANAPSDAVANLSDSSWDDSPPRSQTRAAAGILQSSPLRRPARIQSPESPTPAHVSSSRRLQALMPGNQDRSAGIQIYEDEPELPGEEHPDEGIDVSASMVTEATASFSSSLSDLDDENDPDEENDPIIHSFGPFGADITARLASIATKSPRALKAPRHPLPSSTETLTEESEENQSLPSDPPSPSTQVKAAAKVNASGSVTPQPEQQPAPQAEEQREASPEEERILMPTIELDPAVANHVVNQLAFSRLSSTPLSTIMQHLPNEHKKDLQREVLRQAVEGMACIGIIKRQGKDAAGKPLESEYYYVPDADDDEQRRAAVVDGLRKPSLRNCRKQHKVSFFVPPPHLHHSLTHDSNITGSVLAHLNDTFFVDDNVACFYVIL